MEQRGIKVVRIAPGYIDTPMTEVNDYKMPFLMPVEKFAERAVATMASGCSYRGSPWQMGVLAKGLRLLPDWHYYLRMRREKKEI